MKFSFNTLFNNIVVTIIGVIIKTFLSLLSRKNNLKIENNCFQINQYFETNSDKKLKEQYEKWCDWFFQFICLTKHLTLVSICFLEYRLTKKALYKHFSAPIMDIVMLRFIIQGLDNHEDQNSLQSRLDKLFFADTTTMHTIKTDIILHHFLATGVVNIADESYLEKDNNDVSHQMRKFEQFFESTFGNITTNIPFLMWLQCYWKKTQHVKNEFEKYQEWPRTKMFYDALLPPLNFKSSVFFTNATGNFQNPSSVSDILFVSNAKMAIQENDTWSDYKYTGKFLLLACNRIKNKAQIQFWSDEDGETKCLMWVRGPIQHSPTHTIALLGIDYSNKKKYGKIRMLKFSFLGKKNEEFEIFLSLYQKFFDSTRQIRHDRINRCSGWVYGFLSGCLFSNQTYIKPNNTKNENITLMLHKHGWTKTNFPNYSQSYWDPILEHRDLKSLDDFNVLFSRIHPFFWIFWIWLTKKNTHHTTIASSWRNGYYFPHDDFFLQYLPPIECSKQFFLVEKVCQETSPSPTIEHFINKLKEIKPNEYSVESTIIRSHAFITISETLDKTNLYKTWVRVSGNDTSLVEWPQGDFQLVSIPHDMKHIEESLTEYFDIFAVNFETKCKKLLWVANLVYLKFVILIRDHHEEKIDNEKNLPDDCKRIIECCRVWLKEKQKYHQHEDPIVSEAFGIIFRLTESPKMTCETIKILNTDFLQKSTFVQIILEEVRSWFYVFKFCMYMPVTLKDIFLYQFVLNHPKKKGTIINAFSLLGELLGEKSMIKNLNNVRCVEHFAHILHQANK